jgi:hypothetical protein
MIRRGQWSQAQCMTQKARVARRFLLQLWPMVQYRDYNQVRLA